MQMYYCPNCKLVLKPHEIDKDYEYVTTEAHGQRLTTKHSYLVCGACSSDLEERYVCNRCESALPERGSDYCAPCGKAIDEEDMPMHDQIMSVLIGIATTGAGK